MSHAFLLESMVPLDSIEHQSLMLQRWHQLTIDHARRIHNVNTDRKIIAGEIWLDDPLPGERRVTIPLAHMSASLATSMLLPRPPEISVMPMNQDAQQNGEADIVERWIYAMLDNTMAQKTMMDCATNAAEGCGVLRARADGMAVIEDGELPIIFDAPDPTGVLYHIGARGKMDYGFVKHSMTADEMSRDLGYRPIGHRSPTDRFDVWCYFSEERIRIPGGGVMKIILYGIFERQKLLFPLMDISRVWKQIPLHVAFSQGYNWINREDMRALGVNTLSQQMLIFASDFFSKLANKTVRDLNPAMGHWREDRNDDRADLDFGEGRLNHLFPGEEVKQLLQGNVSPDAMRLIPMLMGYLGDATNPMMLQSHQQQVGGASGTALAESLQPTMMKNQVKQYYLQFALRDWIVNTMRFLGATMPPEGLELYGAHPRNNKLISALVTPDMLLRHTRIHVRLPQQRPREVIQYVQILQGLMRDGSIPRQLGMEQIVELMELPAADMSTLMEMTAIDDAYKAMLDALRQKALETLPFVQQQQYNQGMNPDLLADGAAPHQLSSQAQDPALTASVSQDGPVQQAAQAAQQAALAQ